MYSVPSSGCLDTSSGSGTCPFTPCHIGDQSGPTAIPVPPFPGLERRDVTPAEVPRQFFQNHKPDGRISHAGHAVLSYSLSHVAGPLLT